MEGVATAHGHAVGVIDGVDGQRLVVHGGELHAELLVDGGHFGLVGVITLGQPVGGQTHASIGHEEHLFHVVPAAEVGNHVLAPAEVGLAAHGAVADKEEVSFIHGKGFRVRGF